MNEPLSSTCTCVSHFVHGHFSGPGQFTIIDVCIGACNDIIKVTYTEVRRITIYSYKLCMMVMICHQAVLHALKLFDIYVHLSCVHDPCFRMSPTVPAKPLSGSQLMLMECKFLT